MANEDRNPASNLDSEKNLVQSEDDKGAKNTDQPLEKSRTVETDKQAQIDISPATDDQSLTLSQADLFAKISHEVRTPLNAIIGFSELMQKETFGPLGHKKYREYVNDVLQSAKHALSLINDLLDLSKIEAGEFVVQPEKLNVNETISQSLSTMQPLAQKAGVTLRATLAVGLGPINADPRHLKQIMFNLLSNAIKFTPKGGEIDVKTASGHMSPQQNGNVVIAITDNGIGMSESEMAQAVKPFRQIENTTHSETGSGLGLPLAKALTLANGANFKLTSTKGKGTSVELIFLADTRATS